ncbi:hypothetical protein MTBBW1_1250008 [Desulfamplus magnetovallimortis]|uniref:HAMP domain-containing protein n=1 Tax=Desulfamplus magnetovallimortis TaxID=1246637 RepID=A0A1W1H6J8_9BACT|nr:SpoIIE family protein phosphatase [Desulfamplus magnetovallimortis]SLM28077.1 hypothetical protein MTBBW1_1250008 [Desulfamplus magnetovallimortis]
MTVTRKLLLINTLICAAFVFMIMVVFFSFRHIEEVLTTRFASETHRIIENSNMARELSRVLSDMNLILRTFYEKSEILDTEGKRLFNGIDALLAKSGNEEMSISLGRFKQHLIHILDQCGDVNLVREELRETEKRFDDSLISLDEIIARRLVELMIEGENTSDLEQLSSMVGGWRESFIRMKLTFVNLGLEHFKHPMEEKAHPLLDQADDLQMRLRTLTAATPDIAAHGRELIHQLNQYKALVASNHNVVEKLGGLLEENDLEKETILLLMEKMDTQISRRTTESTNTLKSHINNSMMLNLMIFIGVLPVVILGGMTAYSIKEPTGKIIEYIRRLSRGDVPDPITDLYKGEFALVRDYLNRLIQATRNVTQIAEDIAAGNMGIPVQERSENDRLMQALNRMIQRLDKIISETRGMILSVGAGKMDVRGNAEAFEGGWRDLVAGVNDLIEGLSSAVSSSAALGQEMALARNIQTCLLPAPASIDNIHPDFDISAIMLPADQVGGDFYEIALDREKNLRIAIGDVSGHGVTPGLIMMMAQTVHSTVCANFDSDARDMVVKINEILYANVNERLNENHFMTFNALKYLGYGKFEHAGAHLRIIVYRRKLSQCELIPTEGIYLNFKKDISRPTKNACFEMEEGDIMLLYTDGLTEARNERDELLDIDGLVSIIERHALNDPGCESRLMKDKIMSDVLDWCDKKRDDDMTLLIVRRKEGRMSEENSLPESRYEENSVVIGNFIHPDHTSLFDLSSTLRFRARSIDQKKLWESKDRSAEFMGDIWSLFVDSEKAERIKTLLHSVCVELIENAVKYGCQDNDYIVTIELCLKNDELLVYLINTCSPSRIPALEESARLILATRDIKTLFRRKMREAKAAKKLGQNRSQLGFIRILMQHVNLAWKINTEPDKSAVVITLARIPLMEKDDIKGGAI